MSSPEKLHEPVEVYMAEVGESSPAAIALVRHPVPGGWMYIHLVTHSGGVNTTSCFVPDPDYNLTPQLLTEFQTFNIQLTNIWHEIAGLRRK